MAFVYPYTVFTNHNVYFGLLIAFYFILQIGLATKNFVSLQKSTLTETPSVSILVVGHRENPEYWRSCIQSIKNIQYTNISSICAFIDGEEEEDQYMKTIFEEEFPSQRSPPSHIVLLPRGGKRSVLYHGIRFIRSHHPQNIYIIVVDSDTRIQPDGIHYLVRCIHSDIKNGCATGNIQIFNREDGILPKIIHARYGYAFTVERSAMSAVGVMNCCSGPFSIYRQSVLTEDLLEDFFTQECCGQRVKPGDDRHLTLLVLKKGFYSRQTPFAIAETETPVHLHRYLQQQLRWMRSFYREMRWQIRAIPFQHIYLSIITVYELFFPFFILLSFFPTFRLLPSSNDDPRQKEELFYQRLVIACGILILRTCLLVIFNHKNTTRLSNCWNLLVFPLYFTFLLPLKIYGLFTCGIQSWLTSSRNKILCSCNLDVWFMYGSIGIWWIFLGGILVQFFYPSSIINNI